MSRKRIDFQKDSEICNLHLARSKQDLEYLKTEYEKAIQKGISSRKEDAKIKEETQKKVKSSRPSSKESENSPRKNRNYDVSATREYMKKQKEKRDQMRAQLKQTDNVIEVRKQKLKELHKKSLQIVAKNTRDRSKSRDRQRSNENHLSDLQNLDVNCLLNHNIQNHSPLQKHLNVMSSITLRCSDFQVDDMTPSVSKNYNDLKFTSAAIIIQKYFRGYKQRKQYKIRLQKKRELEKLLEMEAEIKRDYEKQALLKLENDDKNKVQKKKQYHDLLEPCMDDRYTFLNTIKRKLNLMATPSKVDVAVQIDSPVKSQQVKSLIIDHMQSTTSKKGSQIFYFKDGDNLKVFHNSKSDHCSELDLKTVESLKLTSKFSDVSDSDTSKNIPDLSIETLNSKKNSQGTIKYENSFETYSKQHSNSRKSSIQSSISSNSEHIHSNIEQSIKDLSNMNTINSLSVHSLNKIEFDVPAKENDCKWKKSISESNLVSHKNNTEVETNYSGTVKSQSKHKSSFDYLNVENFPENITKSIKSSLALNNRSIVNISDQPSRNISYDNFKKSLSKNESSTSLKTDQDVMISSGSSRSNNTIKSLTKSLKSDNSAKLSITSSIYKKSNNKSLASSEISTKSSKVSILKKKEQINDTGKSSISSKHHNLSDRTAPSDGGKATKSSTSSSIHEKEPQVEEFLFTKPLDIPFKKSKTHKKLILPSDSDDEYKLQFDKNKIKEMKLIARGNQMIFDNTMENYCILENNIDNKNNQNLAQNDEKRRGSIISYNQCKVSSFNNSGTRHAMSLLESTRNHQLDSFHEYMANYPKVIINSEVETSSIHSYRTIKSYKTGSLSQKSSLSKSKKTSSDSTTISENYSTEFPKQSDNVPLLQVPSLSLQSNYNNNSDKENEDNNVATEVVLKAGEKALVETKTNSNQIHVKFEAELHLLNDFNESLRQFMQIEKSLLDLQTKNLTTTVLQNRDTQTSIATTTGTSKNEPKSISVTSTPHSVNTSRGSEIYEDESLIQNNEGIVVINSPIIINNSLLMEDASLAGTTAGFELSEIEDMTMDQSQNESMQYSQVAITPDNPNHLYVGVSLALFEQLIKDEDSRLENLKTTLKIREKALLDRSKGELAWLEIQKKHLLETGRLHEASLIKKKERGIIIKLQHEKHEMQKLKQHQKAASKERKSVLKEQLNMIKAQMATCNIPTKIKKSTSKERRLSGPLKVYSYHHEIVKSETSISRRSSVTEEVVYTSCSDKVTDNEFVEIDSAKEDTNQRLVKAFGVNKKNEVAKRSLLMREAALQKRRKAAEYLLQWHQKLLEEERKINELEMAASNIINQVPSVISENSSLQGNYAFNGNQLNILWRNMTGLDDKKFNDGENYNLSKIALERFCKDALKIANKNKSVIDKTNKSNNSSVSEVSESLKSDSEQMLIQSKQTSQRFPINFETENDIDLQKGINKSECTLNEIMLNISNISDDISQIYKLSSVQKNAMTSKLIEDHSSKDVFTSNSDINSPSSKEIFTNIINEASEEGNSASTNNDNNIPSIITRSVNTSQDIDEINSTYFKFDINSTGQDIPDIISNNNATTFALNRSIKNKKFNSDNESIKSDVINKSRSELILEVNEIEIKHDMPQIKVIDIKKFSTPELINDNIHEITSENNSGSSNKLNEILSESLMESKSLPSDVVLYQDPQNISISKQQSKTSEVSVNIDPSFKQSENSNQLNELSVKSLSSKNFEDMTTLSNVYTEVESQNNSGGTKTISTNKISNYSESLNELNTEGMEIAKITNFSKNKSHLNHNLIDVKLKTTISDQISSEPNSKTTLESNSDNIYSDNSISEDKSESEPKIITSDKVISEHLFGDCLEPSNSVENKSYSEPSKTINLENVEEINSQIKTYQSDSKKSPIKDFDELSKDTTLSPIENIHIFSPKDEKTKSSIIGEDNSLQNEIHICASQKLSEYDASLDKEAKNSHNTSMKKGIKLFQEESEEDSSKITDVLGEVEPSIFEFSEDFNQIEVYNNMNLDLPESEIIVVTKNHSEIEESVVEMIDSSHYDSESELKENVISEVSSQDVDSEVSANIPVIDVTIEEKYYKYHEVNNSIEEEHNENDDKENIVDNEEMFYELTVKTPVDVKKRVSEILADANINSLLGDKSPRMQDLYVTTYDIISPADSPELGSPVDSKLFIPPKDYSNEAEELLRKQLAIEQEIKQLEQQQKEQLPYLYMREIPNKPPPPYKPPVQSPAKIIPSILPPTPVQINLIISEVTNILFGAHNINDLLSIKLPENGNLKNNDQISREFIFDLCKEMAVKHYSQFEDILSVSWLKLNKLTFKKPLDAKGLENMFNQKLQEIFGFVHDKNGRVTKWSRKKKDHVYELLVAESQMEEAEWTNYDQEELIVKNDVTNDIINMLLNETANVFEKIIAKSSLQ